MKVVRDIKSMTDMSEDIDTTLSEDQKAAARRTVCGAMARLDLPTEDLVADATEFMMMLGIHPSQPNEPPPADLRIRRLH